VHLALVSCVDLAHGIGHHLRIVAGYVLPYGGGVGTLVLICVQSASLEICVGGRIASRANSHIQQCFIILEMYGPHGFWRRWQSQCVIGFGSVHVIALA
jgi:hypothetical protein